MITKTFKALLLMLLITNFQVKALTQTSSKKGLDISFKDKKNRFTKAHKKLITKIAIRSEKEVRKLLPNLPKDIKLTIMLIDRKIDGVGGVTGRTNRHNPKGDVIIQLSTMYLGGIKAAAKRGLRAVIYHEFHHLSRGWAIMDNKFGQGIDIAAANEGLAVVFSEVYTKVAERDNQPPKAKEADKWVKEVLMLPKNANYGKWMFRHSDGRIAVGYRSGNYLIRKAMKNSGKTVLELSKLSPKEIYKLAGY